MTFVLLPPLSRDKQTKHHTTLLAMTAPWAPIAMLVRAHMKGHGWAQMAHAARPCSYVVSSKFVFCSCLEQA